MFLEVWIQKMNQNISKAVDEATCPGEKTAHPSMRIWV
jgi:hypothetical protein